MKYYQKVMPEGEKLTLKEFADQAVVYLKAERQFDNEVVTLANDIVELEKDFMTRPDVLYPLSEGYEYRFSGFWGQVIGVVRKEKVNA